MVLKLSLKPLVRVSLTSAKNVIQHWCDQARSNSLSVLIAQSIVDTSGLADHPEIAKALLPDLYSVAKADGVASQSEGIVYNAIKDQIEGSRN